MGSRRISFSLAVLLFFSQGAEAGGVARCLINAMRAESLGSQYRKVDRDIYFITHQPEFLFSKTRSVQDRGFKLFSDHQAVWPSMGQFFRRDPQLLERTLESWKQLHCDRFNFDEGNHGDPGIKDAEDFDRWHACEALKERGSGGTAG